jgi:hypothetical protein
VPATDFHHLACLVVDQMVRTHTQALQLRWIEIGYAIPLCQNGACEAEFEPIVRADPSALLWHVAGSLFTWAHSGVETPPILADTLRRWAVGIDGVDRWCRVGHDADDPYVRFMAGYAARLLDGLEERHHETWLQRYFEILRMTQ